MPLRKAKRGAPRKTRNRAVAANIREMVAAGYPQRQAVAASLDTDRRSQRPPAKRKRPTSLRRPTKP